MSLDIHEGEIVGLIGQSGSGKSTLAKSIIGIEKITEGEIYYLGKNISNNNKYRKEKSIISKGIQIIFQDYASSLNPIMNVEKILSEPFRINKNYKRKKEALNKVKEILNKVELDESYMNKHPYELSGGQCQKVAIARALITCPKLLIADEALASLDVSMQAQIINLLKKINKETKLSCLFITHDLSVARYISDKIAVMKNGNIIEMDKTEKVFKEAKEDYTKKLIESVYSLRNYRL